MRNLNWFREAIVPYLDGFEIKSKTFEDGDFGDLETVEFNGLKLCGGMDFWSSGMLGIDLLDQVSGEDLMNVLINPENEDEKVKKIEELIVLLKTRA